MKTWICRKIWFDFFNAQLVCSACVKLNTVKLLSGYTTIFLHELHVFIGTVKFE